MLKRGSTGRRFWLVIAVAAFGAMVYAAFALADSDTIVAGPAESFDRQATGTPYSTDQGVVVQFQNNGGTHNVTARQAGPDGKALFSSPTIDGGTTVINGTQYLTPGDYPFYCTVHPTTMSGTLRVTLNGTAMARPSATAKLRTKTIAKALKGLMVSINSSAKVDGVTVTAKLGKATIGKATASLFAGTQTVKVKLSKAGKSKLRNKSTAKVTVTADIPFGFPATAKGKLK